MIAENVQVALAGDGISEDFVAYVSNLRSKRAKYDGTWKPTQVMPCPLLSLCTVCKKYLPVINFYHDKGSGRRLDACGVSRTNRCPACQMADYFKRSPELNLYHAAKRRAKIKGLEFSLVPEDITIPEYCPVLGLKLEPFVGRGRETTFYQLTNSPTIDRLDNAKGYVKENIQVISYRANSLKNNGTLEEFEAVVRYIKDNLPPQMSNQETLFSQDTNGGDDV